MSPLFLSHSSVDRRAAEELKCRLGEHGFESIFLDVDPESGIQAGADWERTLYTELRSCEAVVFLSSPSSLGSRWCFAELVVARFLNKPIFEVVIAAGERHALLAAGQAVDATPGIAAAVPRLVRGLVRQGLDPESSVFWDPTRPPYPGLAPFEEEDAAVFVGRGEETRTLLEWLPPQASTVVAVVGPSGSGKSSLVRAGLVPRLRRRDEWVVLPVITPGRLPLAQPTAALAAHLAGALQAAGRATDEQDVTARLAEGPAGLLDLLRELVQRSPGASAVLVVLDQGEELAHQPEQASFLTLLYGAAQPGSPLSVLVTVRSELVTEALQPPGVQLPVIRSLPVGPLDRAKLADVIRQPAERAGFPLTDELILRMAQDTEGGDALPLLAYTLRHLYDEHPPGRRQGPITLADYLAIGGVHGAVRSRADAAAARLPTPTKPLLFPTLLLLATVEGSGPPVRRRVRLGSLSAAQKEVVQAFQTERLLTTAGEGAGTTVEVAHEALFRVWAPLREELDRRRGELRLRAQVDRLAADWEQEHQPAGHLLSSERLAALRTWDWQRELSEQGQRFVRASLQADEERQRRADELARARQLAGRVTEAVSTDPVQAAFLAVEALSLELALAPGVVGTEVTAALRSAARWARERQRATADSALVCLAVSPDGRLIAAGALDGSVHQWNAQGQPAGPPLRLHLDEAAAVALGAGDLQVSGGVDGQLVIRDPSTGPGQVAVAAHAGGVTSVGFVADGQLIATGGHDGRLRLWTRTGEPVGEPVVAHEGPVTAVAPGLWGADVATAGWDGLVRLWDRQGALVSVLEAHDHAVTALAVSPEAALVATGSAEGTVRLWRAATEASSFSVGSSAVLGLALGPDGRTLASITDSEDVRLWTLDGQVAGDPLVGHRRGLRGVAFRPDGEAIATVSLDRTLRLWDRHGLALAAPFRAHRTDVNAVAFSPDGQTIVSGGADGLLRTSDLRGREQAPAWPGHRGFVFALAVSGDGQSVVSGGEDGLVHLWDVSGYPLGPPLAGGSGQINAIAVHPSRPLVLTGCKDGTAALYSFDRLVASLPAHAESVQAVAFSPDGQYLVTAAADGSLRLWSPDGVPLGDPLLAHATAVQSVAISPDARVVVTGAVDGSIRFVDRHGRLTGEPVQVHESSVEAIAFDPAGRLMVTAGRDGTVQVRTPEGDAVGPPCAGHDGAVWTVAVAPGGGTIASGGADGTVRTWVGGRWEDNLRVLCERLRHHPSVREPGSDLAARFAVTCQERPWQPPSTPRP